MTKKSNIYKSVYSNIKMYFSKSPSLQLNKNLHLMFLLFNFTMAESTKAENGRRRQKDSTLDVVDE